MVSVNPSDLIVYVDIDDTLVRSFGSKRMPMVAVVEHVKRLRAEGVTLFCWSSGGGEYARSSARELNIENLFAAFLPKPHVLLDDQAPSEWSRLLHVHPAEAPEQCAQDYMRAIETRGAG
jgi:hypothetical protein